MIVPGVRGLELLATGANGAVYAGVDSSDGTPVAVKVMRAGIDGGERRFRREVRAMERLADIPAVVPIIRSGVVEEDRPYLVMPLYAQSLQDVLESSGPLAPGAAVDLAIRVGSAIADAHALGVLHLDLKPSNLLLDDEGAVVVADFGIAEFSDASVSMSAAVMTPQYAPPERFSDVKPNEASDVYSLAATLFALLRGGPPFSTAANSSAMAVMMRIVNDPPPLEELGETASPRLVAAIGSAMVKDPALRPSAAEFVDALRRVDASTAGDLVADVSPSIEGDEGTTLAVSPMYARVVTGRPAEPLESGRASSSESGDDGLSTTQASGSLSHAVATAGHVPQPARARWLRPIGLILVAAFVVGAVALVVPRGGDPVSTSSNAGANAADVERLAAAGVKRTSFLIRAESDELEATLSGLTNATVVAALPDGRVVTNGSSEDGLLIWDHVTGDVLPVPGSSGVLAVTVLADGRIAAGTIDETITVWDVDRLEGDSLVLNGHTGPVSAIDALDDGRIVSGSSDSTVRVWDPDRPEDPPITASADFDPALTVLPDDRIVFESNEGVLVWNPDEPESSAVAAGEGVFGANAFAALPDGRVVALTFDDTLWLFDPDEPDAPARTFGVMSDGFGRGVAALGGTLVAAANDSVIRVWDASGDGSAAPALLIGHANNVAALAPHPDGGIVSVGWDGTARVWRLPADSGELDPALHQAGVTALTTLPTGAVVTGGDDGTIRVWNPQTGIDTIRIDTPGSQTRALVGLADGRVASGGTDNLIRVWDPQDRDAAPVSFLGHLDSVSTLSLLPSGDLLSGSWDGTVKRWDLEDPTLRPETFGSGTNPIQAVSSLPDGRFASQAFAETVSIWDPAQPDAPQRVLPELQNRPGPLASTANGQLVVDGTVGPALWDPDNPASGAVVLGGHTGRLTVLRVLTDGRIVAASEDGTLRLWTLDDPSTPILLAAEGQPIDYLAELTDGGIVYVSGLELVVVEGF